MSRRQQMLLALLAFAIGEANPIGWLYWKVAESMLPRMKVESLAEPSPFEAFSPEHWIAQSEQAFAVKDGDPQAPTHVPVISKRRVPSLLEASPELLSDMLVLARGVAREHGIADDGFRVVINTNPKGAQSVYHLHMHVLGGRQMRWPPG